MLRQRPLERQRGPLGKDAEVRSARPRHEVVRQAMRLLIGPCHNDERPRPGHRRPARRDVRGSRRGGHTKDARFRQMGPKGVDERCNTAITAA